MEAGGQLLLKDAFSSPAEVHLWNKYWAVTTGEEESVSSREACKLKMKVK